MLQAIVILASFALFLTVDVQPGADLPHRYQRGPFRTRNFIEDFWYGICKKHRSVLQGLRNASNLRRVAKRVGLRPYHDFPRVVAVHDFGEWVRKYGIESPERLLTFDDDYELKLLKPKEVLRRIFNARTGHNDLHMPLPNTSNVSLAVLSQTLEHLWDPGLAVSNIVDVLEPGGYLYASVPFTNIPHDGANHFCHFTPMGLAVLFLQAGLEVLEVDWWGSEEYEVQLFTLGRLHKSQKLGWPGFGRLTNLAGDGDLACMNKGHIDQVWALARKPGQSVDLP